jgi:hypothetical protein
MRRARAHPPAAERVTRDGWSSNLRDSLGGSTAHPVHKAERIAARSVAAAVRVAHDEIVEARGHLGRDALFARACPEGRRHWNGTLNERSGLFCSDVKGTITREQTHGTVQGADPWHSSRKSVVR